VPDECHDLAFALGQQVERGIAGVPDAVARA